MVGLSDLGNGDDLTFLFMAQFNQKVWDILETNGKTVIKKKVSNFEREKKKEFFKAKLQQFNHTSLSFVAVFLFGFYIFFGIDWCLLLILKCPFPIRIRNQET